MITSLLNKRFVIKSIDLNLLFQSPHFMRVEGVLFVISYIEFKTIDLQLQILVFEFEDEQELTPIPDLYSCIVTTNFHPNVVGNQLGIIEIATPRMITEH